MAALELSVVGQLGSVGQAGILLVHWPLGPWVEARPEIIFMV